jgi:hypothetical protein
MVLWFLREERESLMEHRTIDESDSPSTSSLFGLPKTAPERLNQTQSDFMATAANVVVVGVAAAFFEVSLIPGIALGAAAAWLPRYFSKMDEALGPHLRTTARGVNAARTAVDVFKVVSSVGRLGLRVSRRR